MTISHIFEQKLLSAALFTPKVLIGIVGRIPAALLQQLHYASQNSNFKYQGNYWVSMTQSQWAEKLVCSIKTIQRAFDRLESLGLVISDRLHKHRYYQRKSYRVNYEVLIPLLEKEEKRLEAPSLNDLFDEDISTDLNNKSLNKEFKRQQTEQPMEKVQDPSLHPVSVSGIDKEEILMDPVTPCKETEIETLEMDGLTGQIQESHEGQGMQETLKASPTIETMEMIENLENVETLQNFENLEFSAEVDEPETIEVKEIPVKKVKKVIPRPVKKSDKPQPQAELDPALEAEIVKTVGHNIGVSLKKLVFDASLEVVQNALAVVKTTANPRNKAGLLYRAIEGRWFPSSTAVEREEQKLDPDFNEWWGYIQKLGFAVASVKQDGQLLIYATHNSVPETYDEFRAMFPMSWLKKKLQLE